MSEREQLEQAMTALEAQRAVLGDAVLALALAPLREKLVALAQAAAPEERRQLVTVCFVEVLGLNALAERIDPEEVQDLLRQLWQRLDHLIVRYGGHIDKHIGYAVMAVWGLASPGEDRAVQGLQAALALQAELAAFCAEQHVELAARIGINTGLASVTTIASTGERNVIGDAVNLAARLQQAAPPGGVLVSQAAYDQVRGLFQVAVQPPLTVKGRSEPVQTYCVLQEIPRAAAAPTRGLAGVAARTVGREAELAVLRAAYEQTLAGQGMHWVTVTGEAGIGKSRLLAEFERWLAQRPEPIQYIKGRAWPQAEHSPYFLLRDLVMDRFHIGEGDAPAVAREKLTGGLAEALGDDLGTEAAAFIGHLLGFDYGQSRWIVHIADDARQIRGRAEVVLSAFLAQVSADRPVVVLLEDLHWADAESLALLAGMFAELQPWQLCIVGMARPIFWEQRGARWGQVPRHQRVDLRALSAAESTELVYELLQKVAQPPEWLVDLLVERGGGHPYFTEELVRWLIEQGVIEMGSAAGAWFVKAASSLGLSVPATVQGVLQARLERLDADERATLQQAAVFGRTFWEGAVSHVRQAPVPPQHWERLQQRDLIVREPESQLAGETEYHFKHILLRDVVYEYTLKKLRRTFHRRAGEWLARSAAERAGEWAVMIAGHYELAGETGLAIEYLNRAGTRALQISAFWEARAHCERALALVAAPGGDAANYGRLSRAGWRMTLARQLGETHWGLGDYPAARAALEESLALARQIGDAQGIAAALGRLGRIAFDRGEFAEARRYLEESLALGREIGDRSGLVLTLRNLGNVAASLGHFPEAILRYEESLALAREIGDPAGTGAALANLGRLTYRMRADAYALARERYGEAIEICREINNRWALSVCLCNLGIIAYRLGEYLEAQRLQQESLAIAKEIGNQWMVGWALGELGLVACELGDEAEAARCLREALHTALQAGVVPRVLYAVAGWAHLRAKQGRPAQALEWLGLALGHPACDSDVRQIAEPLRAELEASLPPEVAASALAAERRASDPAALQAAVAEILKG